MKKFFQAFLAIQVVNVVRAHCENNNTFTHENLGCIAIRNNEEYREKICKLDEVRQSCQQSCGLCCEDHPTYTFKNENGITKKCAWIKNKKQRKNNCQPTNSQHGRTIRDACPKSCYVCQVVEVSKRRLKSTKKTKRPSSEPSEIPSSNPTTYPSGELSSHPSQQPTEIPSSNPTTYPSGQPSSHPSQQPTVCQDEPGWVVGGSSIFAGMSCADINANSTGWCDLFQGLNDDISYEGKVISEACCDCGGGDHQIVFPSSSPTTQPSVSLEPSLPEFPSTVPSSQPTMCRDEPGWHFPVETTNGATSEVACAWLGDKSDLCERFRDEYFQAKNVFLACCICGGADHLSVAPSDMPSTLPSTSPSDRPSRSPSISPSLSPSTKAPVITLGFLSFDNQNAASLYSAAVSGRTINFNDDENNCRNESCISSGSHSSCSNTSPFVSIDVSSPPIEVNFGQLVDTSTEGCCSALSCVYGYIDTDSVTVGVNGVRFAFDFGASEDGDWYEVVIALYSTSGGPDMLVDAKVYRGQTLNNAMDELTFTGSGTYFLRFFAASYDQTGGRVLGSNLRVESFAFNAL